VTTFWQGDLGETIANACELADPVMGSPHLAAWLQGYDASAPVSSNVGSHDVPFQRWMKFKEAFSPKFVVDAIAAMPRTPKRCVDPFGGSGTTALTCSFLGIEAVTIEVNPFLADLIESKLKPPSAFELSASYETVLELARSATVDIGPHLRRLPPSFCEPPTAGGSTAAGRFVFWRDALARILILRMAIEVCPDERSRRLLKVLLGSVLVPASNVVVNGKGRRYRRGWSKRRIWAADIDQLFCDAVRRAARDLGAFGGRARTSATLLRGDSRLLMKSIDTVDAAIFSPPYPNSFDYTDVYNLELWVLGYLDGAAANRALRRSTLRSHVQVAFENPTLEASGLLATTVERLKCARGRLWDPRIPEMVLGYFEDMDAVMGTLHARMTRGGRVVMVVGDSQYAGIQVDVAAVLRERAEALGFSTVETREIRSMRSSAQHGGHYELAETCLVLERE
jgi:hypothetical protein